jgi:hypothetical protein
MSEESSLDRIMSGKTWDEFCDTLKEAGRVITKDSSPDDPLTRAEGFRYIARIVRATTEAFLEYNDPLAPVLFRPIHETAKLGADNPDNYYQHATIDGKYEYRIHGKRNDINYLAFGTYEGNYGSAGRSGETGYLENSQIEAEDDGTIEIMVSREKKGKNWLPMTENTSSVIVRQTFGDRTKETPAELAIERIGGDGKPSPVTPETIDQGLTVASKIMFGAVSMFSSWAEGFREHENRLPRFDPDVSLAAHGDPNICYYHSYWKLGPDEALVIDVHPPKCAFWNFQLNNFWMESLDYRYYNIWTNMYKATYRDDGSLRVVVAHRDPGVPNWIETVEHGEGTMLWRWFEGEDCPEPATRVVPVESVKELD